MSRDGRTEVEVRLHPLWDPYPEFQLRLAEVAEHLGRVMDDTPALIRDDLSLVLTPGKMLRPAFVLMSSTAGSERSDNITKVAAAVELLHTATLIHDDVIDQSQSRRNNPSLHVQSGLKRAVLAGDYLFAKALELAASSGTDGLVEATNEAVSRICISEIEQDSDPGNYFIDRSTYFNRIRGKTAELFALSCKAGAVLGGADSAAIEDFYRAGMDFGLAFQIVDDVLDYRGLPGSMGKPAGNDLKDGIPTLPLIMAIESGDALLRRMCRSRFKYILKRQIRRRVLNGGWDKKASDTAAEYLGSSLSILRRLNFEDRDLFTDVVGRLLKS